MTVFIPCSAPFATKSYSIVLVSSVKTICIIGLNG